MINTVITAVDSALLVSVANRYIPCQNFQECSIAIKHFVDLFDLGASSFYDIENIGLILHHKKGAIAKVSYNGRVWKFNGNESDLNKEEIKDLLLNDI